MSSIIMATTSCAPGAIVPTRANMFMCINGLLPNAPCSIPRLIGPDLCLLSFCMLVASPFITVTKWTSTEVSCTVDSVAAEHRLKVLILLSCYHRHASHLAFTVLIISNDLNLVNFLAKFQAGLAILSFKITMLMPDCKRCRSLILRNKCFGTAQNYRRPKPKWLPTSSLDAPNLRHKLFPAKS